MVMKRFKHLVNMLTRCRLFIKTTSCRRLWYWQVSLSILYTHTHAHVVMDLAHSFIAHLDPVSSITFLKTSVCIFPGRYGSCTMLNMDTPHPPLS